jgi:hypothetical protein
MRRADTLARSLFGIDGDTVKRCIAEPAGTRRPLAAIAELFTISFVIVHHCTRWAKAEAFQALMIAAAMIAIRVCAPPLLARIVYGRLTVAEVEG